MNIQVYIENLFNAGLGFRLYSVSSSIEWLNYEVDHFPEDSDLNVVI